MHTYGYYNTCIMSIVRATVYYYLLVLLIFVLSVRCIVYSSGYLEPSANTAVQSLKHFVRFCTYIQYYINIRHKLKSCMPGIIILSLFYYNLITTNYSATIIEILNVLHNQQSNIPFSRRFPGNTFVIMHYLLSTRVPNRLTNTY